jgi:hypothetical protein
LLRWTIAPRLDGHVRRASFFFVPGAQRLLRYGMASRTGRVFLAMLSAAALALGERSAAATPQAKEPSRATAAPNPKNTSKIVTLTGCVSSDPERPGGFVLVASDTSRYRLTGTNVREYAGQRVQVAGSTPRRMRIAGGLSPSPNVAAQAGAIDPNKAAIATADAAANAQKALLDFRVRSVRAVTGACPE